MFRKNQKGEAGTMVIVVLVVALLSWIHTATGGDQRTGDKGVTVRPAPEEKR